MCSDETERGFFCVQFNSDMLEKLFLVWGETRRQEMSCSSRGGTALWENTALTNRIKVFLVI